MDANWDNVFVFLGELFIIMGVIGLRYFPWIGVILLIGMIAYDIPRRYKANRDRATYQLPDYYLSEFDEDDTRTYRSTKEIFASGRFSAEERRQEYRRRGKSPSGVIDSVYNDMYLEDGASYNDMDRDWDSDAYLPNAGKKQCNETANVNVNFL